MLIYDCSSVSVDYLKSLTGQPTRFCGFAVLLSCRNNGILYRQKEKIPNIINFNRLCKKGPR